MNNVLFDSYPIVVSQELAGLLTSLDKRNYPRLSEAAVLQQVHYWIQKKINYHDGRYWVYNSLEEWTKQFTWIKTKATMKKQFDWLEGHGIIVTGNYNKMKMDRTKWYSIDYDRLKALYDAFYYVNNMDLLNIDNSNLSSLVNANDKDDNSNTKDYTKTTPKTTKENILSGKPDGIPYSEIVDYLNKKTGKKFKATTDKTKRLIKARFKEGFEVADFKQVVDNQTQAWLNSPKWSKYLRPETLFGPKFESYLNARPAKQQQGGGGINGVYF